MEILAGNTPTACLFLLNPMHLDCQFSLPTPLRHSDTDLSYPNSGHWKFDPIKPGQPIKCDPMQDIFDLDQFSDIK
ncbi:MAG: hypothetical protein CTY19_15360 [Methylomonas sp.]|nr:MAG: hypothetical protein CTY19_15360 [Methylomonas sp.]